MTNQRNGGDGSVAFVKEKATNINLPAAPNAGLVDDVGAEKATMHEAPDAGLGDDSCSSPEPSTTRGDLGAFSVFPGTSPAQITSRPFLTPHDSASTLLHADDSEDNSDSVDVEAVATITTAQLIENPVCVRAEEVVAPADPPSGNDGQSSNKRVLTRVITITSLLAVMLIIMVVPIVVTRQSHGDERTYPPSPLPAEAPSPPPTPAPTSEEFRSSILKIVVAPISHSDTFLDDASPQSKAFDWLVQDVVPLNNTMRILQRYVLAVLYFSTGGGEDWLKEYNFLSSSHECDWTDDLAIAGVKTCSKDFNVITSLDFANNGLVGYIPSELATLDNLGQLRFLGNPKLTGPIPVGLGNMSDLSFLSLVGNNLTGTIPPSLGNLTKLMGLWLHQNALTGIIPNTLGNLSSVIWLQMHENQLTGTTPSSFSNLLNATQIWLDGNQLSGSVDFLCDTLENLEKLHVNRSTVECQCCECCN